MDKRQVRRGSPENHNSNDVEVNAVPSAALGEVNSINVCAVATNRSILAPGADVTLSDGSEAK